MRYQSAKSTLMDLKLYGSDFMKIDEENLPLITNVPHDPHRNPIPNPTKVPRSLDISFNSLHCDHPLQQIKKIEQEMTRKYDQMGKATKSLTKVQKLRDKISVIKRLNEQKHRDILDLYNKNSSDLVADFHIKKKSIRKITLFDPQAQQRKIKMKEKRDQNEEFLNKFYDSLQKEDQSATMDYRKRLVEIQNKLKNSNIPRKVEEFLVSKNMRIPKFLKELKY